MKRLCFTTLAVIALALSGCGDGSVSPVGPAYSGGLVVGGNVVEPSDTTGQTTTGGSEGDDSGGLVVGGN